MRELISVIGSAFIAGIVCGLLYVLGIAVIERWFAEIVWLKVSCGILSGWFACLAFISCMKIFEK